MGIYQLVLIRMSGDYRNDPSHLSHLRVSLRAVSWGDVNGGFGSWETAASPVLRRGQGCWLPRIFLDKRQCKLVLVTEVGVQGTEDPF